MSEQIEGRNAVLEAFRSGKCVDKLFILDGCQDGPILTIKREAKKAGSLIKYADKQLLDNISAGIPQVCCSAPSRIDLIDFAAI